MLFSEEYYSGSNLGMFSSALDLPLWPVGRGPLVLDALAISELGTLELILPNSKYSRIDHCENQRSLCSKHFEVIGGLNMI